MKNKRWTLGLAAALTLAGGISFSEAASAQKPNILLILADDLGYGDLGCHGAELVKTPRIDRLASEGVRFLDAHAPAAVCQPTRYGILAGRYNWRRGSAWDGKMVFEKGEQTLQRVLKGAGYNTACIGKWHLGFDHKPLDYNKALKPGPLETGFDYFFGTPRTHNEPPFVFVENYHVVGLDPDDPIRIVQHADVVKRGLKDWGWGISEGAKAAHEARPEDQVDIKFAEKAVEWIGRQSADKPFFLYLPFVAPHVPNSPAKQFAGLSGAGKYGDVIQQLDWCVGEVLDALEGKGLAENTLVIFTSDNGGCYIGDALNAGHHCNGPLLGQKTDAWEGGNRIFLSLTDIMATVSAATGVALPEGAGEDSMDQLPVILNPEKAEPVRESMVYTGIFGQGLRSGNWVYYPFQGSGGMTAHPTIKWGQPFEKMDVKNSDLNENGTLKADAPPAQLYNVHIDPAQKTNVYSQHPERVAEMQKMLDKIISK